MFPVYEEKKENFILEVKRPDMLLHTFIIP